MGCGNSRSNEIDYSEVTAAKVAKAQAQAARRMEHGESYTDEQSAIIEKSLSTSMEPAHGFHGLLHDTAKAAKASIAVLTSSPQLTKQVSAAATRVTKQVTLGAHHLKNIFAHPLENMDGYVPPHFAKGEEERRFIATALQQNFVFSAVTEAELRIIIDAFEKIEVKAGQAIITQGEPGDFFYVIREGDVHYEVNGHIVGKAKKGQSFGELALLYTSPRAATVVPDVNCVLYRVDQRTFRYILQTQTTQTIKDKQKLLQGVEFFKDLDPHDLDKLIKTMTPRKFEAEEYLVRKGEEGDTFYLIQDGKVRVTDIIIGATKYEDQVLGPGDYFGERALITKEPRAANCISVSAGIALVVDKDTFEKVVGSMAKLVLKSQDKRKLSAIKLIQQSHLSGRTLSALASQVVDKRFPPLANVVTEAQYTPAALYLVREGKVEVRNRDGTVHRVIEDGGYFGEDMLAADVTSDPDTAPGVSTDVLSNYSATVIGGEAVLGVLTLESCRRIVDTTMLGQGARPKNPKSFCADLKLESLTRHKILGAGTFGQVWLVSKDDEVYALKIQSKYELIRNSQAKGVVQERHLMSKLRHPFIIHLIRTYQDERFVYMLLGLVQGGELFSLIHQATHDGIKEKDSKFYASGILEGLTCMHRRHILYRDLKPENILIDEGGYPVIVDLGFSKFVTFKTYTLCGTPLYLAPEVILNRGHDFSADHWSFAVLLFEMIAGVTPFYVEGIDQITLFRYIVGGEYAFPPSGVMSKQLEDLLSKFLVVEPEKRLGSLANGIQEIYNHPWFAEYDFARLRRKEYTAPWIPTIKDPLDNSNFENWDHLIDKTQTRDEPLISAKDQIIFESF